MLQRLLAILLITISYLNSQTIDTMGRGGVDIAIGSDSHSILLNPSNLSNIDIKNLITLEPINSSISLNRDSFNFIKKLYSSTDNGKEVSDLMKKNIGKILSFQANNFASIYKKESEYTWLIGLNNDIKGYFITHSGFGSKGAMESSIEQYRAVIGTLSSSQQNLQYGVTLKAIEKYQTIHNYSIGEIIENRDISDYFDNKYTKKEKAIAVDTGISYTLPNSLFNTKIALSVLNIGDTTFKNLGEIPSTTNIGFSSKYNEFLFGMDYIDLFKAEQNSNFKDAIRFGLSRSFLDNRVTVSSGILYENLTFGLSYQYSILNISLSTYTDMEYDYSKERKYKLSFSVAW